MTPDPAHSPAPFLIESLPPKGQFMGGYLLKDSLGDSIGSLAWRTGDHPPEEQLANALLFRASPQLLASAKAAEAFIRGFEGDPLQEGVEQLLADLRGAIALAEQPE